eukprot:1576467-Pleurochrysis_carterae.AAC.1
MARSPILSMVSIIVATGTTLNTAADRIHQFGPRGISHISLHQRIPLVETPIAIGYIAISERDRDRGQLSSVLRTIPNNWQFDPRARPTLTSNCHRARPFIVVRQSCAMFAVLDPRRMHTCGALALRSPSSWILSLKIVSFAHASDR